jgi:preprotein translocase subunit SecF
MVIQGCFLFLFGPFLAGLITPNLMEQASVWCFFSIAQIAIMLFCIRETLITNWGRDKTHGSLLTGKSAQVSAEGAVVEKEARATTRSSSKKKPSAKAE